MRLTLGFLIAAVLAAPAAASLQEGSQAVAFRGGLAIPAGRTADSTKQGFSFGGEFRHQLLSRLSLGVDAEYLALADRPVPATAIRTGGDVFTLGAVGRWDFFRGSPNIPFAFAGFGLSRISTRLDGPGVPQTRETDWNPGVILGGGIERAISNQIALGLSGRYRSMGDAGYMLSANVHIGFALVGREANAAAQAAPEPVRDAPAAIPPQPAPAPQQQLAPPDQAPQPSQPPQGQPQSPQGEPQAPQAQPQQEPPQPPQQQFQQQPYPPPQDGYRHAPAPRSGYRQPQPFGQPQQPNPHQQPQSYPQQNQPQPPHGYYPPPGYYQGYPPQYPPPGYYPYPPPPPPSNQ